METKTIRFEKGEVYPETLVHFFYDKNIGDFSHNKGRDHSKGKGGENYMKCLKSFTVEIKIVEDEES